MGVPVNPLVRLLEYEEWYTDAACTDHDVISDAYDDQDRPLLQEHHVAHIDDWHSNVASRTARAKAVCHTCPVLDLCLETALARREKGGVWGGLEPHERGKLQRDRRQGRSAA